MNQLALRGRGRRSRSGKSLHVRAAAAALLVLTVALAQACATSTEPESDSADVSAAQTPLLTEQALNTGPGALPPKTVILTFDDGPDGPPGSSTPDMTIALAQYLSSQGVHATFFINGRRFTGQSPSSACPLGDSGGVPNVGHASGPFRQYGEAVLDTLVSFGHRIANHTQDHCDLSNNPAYVDQELLATQVILDRHSLNGPFLFRPPYGDWNGAVDENNAVADACLDKLEGPVNWDVDGGDWGCFAPVCPNGDPGTPPNCQLGPPSPAVGVAGCLQGYIDNLKLRPNLNGIFLHHDRPEPAVSTADMYGNALQGANNYVAQGVTVTNPDGTVTTLPGTYPQNELGFIKAEVTWLKAQGYSFARMEDIYSGRRTRAWSTATSCASAIASGVMDYSDGDAGGTLGTFNAAPGYYRSFHLADVNNDGFADACARVGSGIKCALNSAAGRFNAKTAWLTNNFLDSQGWSSPQYGSTVQFADVNADGRADVCGRGIGGVVCAASNGSSFVSPTQATSGSDFTDGSGWAALESYYGSLRYGDVNGDGKLDLCGRSAFGVRCAINSSAVGGTAQFNASTIWQGSDFTDALGWSPAQYGSTLQLGDINGDGRADMCARGGSGMRCALAQVGGGFGAAAWWSTSPDFSDSDAGAGNWLQPYYYASIRLVDIDHDGRADVCGRTANGVVCARSTGSSFQKYQLLDLPAETTSGTVLTTVGNDFTNALGWGADAYGSTLQFGDVDHDGLPDVCGRGTRGLLCSLTRSPCAASSAIGDKFGPGTYGCKGHVMWESRATLCGPQYHVCTATEWINGRDGVVPTHDYWTATNLGYSGTSGACFGSTGGNSCANGTTAEPMRVCTATGTDAEGNTCNWTHCGINTVKPDDYIGGCSNNMFAGSLCCGND